MLASVGTGGFFRGSIVARDDHGVYVYPIRRDWEKRNSKDHKRSHTVRMRIQQILGPFENQFTEIAIGEVVTNAFRHGFGLVIVVISIVENHYTVTVSNTAYEQVEKEPKLPERPVDCENGGMGRTILLNLADYSEAQIGHIFAANLTI
ncbi:TPA: hypothetical protein DD449_03430 [Candidatus Berkelbacteria bacterium]|uniref:Histidine kinase/HSP90-like ATPase domain-containing protein n=1 Tax=Berkelbacteria bacterium GW2011_GWE1_39_12 TaxID=1618337 RepID=A0A0G4B551_9BACT|nr:MAG: hypothetical protein UT28_C0001G0318 [Berkelbacteria bacterium GW2011_GWE1_39_12]HBO60709.1 hypothetical protein [Candidatus Berkelbacteria bacterium]